MNPHLLNEAWLNGAWLLWATVVPALAWCGAVWVEHWRWGHHRRRVLRTDPSRLLEPKPARAILRGAGAVIGVWLVLALTWQLAVPVEAGALGPRAAALLRGVAAVACATALLLELQRAWRMGLAELGLGLMTLGVCSFATAWVPGAEVDLARRYPMQFNALLVALGIMTWLWAWLARVWQQQVWSAPPTGVPPAWTVAGRLVEVSRRFALVTGWAGVMMALLMAIWPAWRVVAAGDDTLGRMTAGIAGHLVLLLALLGAGRYTGWRVFRHAATLDLLSLVLFVALRAHPYMP